MAFGEFRGLDLRRVAIAPKQSDALVQILAEEISGGKKFGWAMG